MTLVGGYFDRTLFIAFLASLAVHGLLLAVWVYIPAEEKFQVVSSLDIRLGTQSTQIETQTASSQPLPASSADPDRFDSDQPSKVEERSDTMPEARQQPEMIAEFESEVPRTTVITQQSDAGSTVSLNDPRNLPSIAVADVRSFIDSTLTLGVPTHEETSTIEEHYRRQWHKRVQRIGQLNYPASAIRQRISGRLTMNVAINSDGSLASVGILESSGHDALDFAALDIVKQTEPYDPLPPAMPRVNGEYRFQSTWEFRR